MHRLIVAALVITICSLITDSAKAQNAGQQSPSTTRLLNLGPGGIDSDRESEPSLSGTATSPTKQEEDPNGFRVYWNNGLRMETNDGRFQVRLGGRMQDDWVFWGDDAQVKDTVGGVIQDGTEFRRARLFVQGYLYEKVEFKAQYDFAGGDVVAKDLYFGIRAPKYGLRIGHMKEPFSLEALMSSNYITFVERALPNVFSAERNTGFLLHGNIINGRFNYGIGVFRETDKDSIGDLPSRYNITGRFAGALVNRDGGRRLVHAGGSFTFQNGSGADRVFKARPEIHLSPRFITTGAIPTRTATVFALETAVVSGSFSAQAEWHTARLSSPETGNPVLSGWYAYASYFLTGESRNYSHSIFGRITPRRNLFDGDSGLGAFEVAARYSVLDFDAEGIYRPEQSLIKGNRLNNLTLALNWHWNPLTLMRFNAIRSEVASARDVGEIWAFLWRGQLQF